MVLVVDGDVASRESHIAALNAAGLPSLSTANAVEGLALLAAEDIALVLCDAALADGSGLDFLARCRTSHRGVPVILTTEEGSLAVALLALRTGVCDYLVKPIPADSLVQVCTRVLQERDVLQQIDRYRRAASCVESPHDLIGSSRPIRELGRLIDSASASRSTVLLTGESGTGKELVSRAIHRRTQGPGGPFVAINCAALPEPLFEGELFGSRKGAFTGAFADRIGFFEAARGGTLFLDEIGDLPLTVQPKLLRAIERKEIVRVGDTRPITVDVRLIAATNRDLKKESAERRFREDLYYRLHVLAITLPPLRERKDDIPLLVDNFVSRFNRDLKKGCLGLEPDALKAAIAYDWPGNVRELENAIERAMHVASTPYLTAADLELVPGGLGPAPVESDDLKTSLARHEAEHISRVLTKARGNRENAARLLGIGPSTLYRKMNELGLHALEPPL